MKWNQRRFDQPCHFFAAEDDGQMKSLLGVGRLFDTPRFFESLEIEEAQRSRPPAGSAPPRPSAGPLCPRRIHFATSAGFAGVAEQTRNLLLVISCCCRHPAASRPRPAPSRRRDWILRRAPYLESAIAAS